MTTDPERGPAEAPRGSPWLRALRPRHWLKNLLVFLPIMAAHEVSAEALARASLLGLAFCLAASGTYLVNDVADRDADRRNPEKRLRPVASGEIGPREAVGAALGLFAAALAAAAPLGLAALLAVTAYIALSTGYTAWLKARKWGDIVTLSSLYLLRVWAGAVATGVALSPWLLAFVASIFVCLASVKRLNALARLPPEADDPHHTYSAGDVDKLLLLCGVAVAGGLPLLPLYTASEPVHALYDRPDLVAFAVVPIAAWQIRLIRLSLAGRQDFDLFRFVTRDAAGLALLAGALICPLLAL